MQCPNCSGVQLVMSERQGIEIDYCPTCRGVWLDRGELDKIIDRSGQAAPPSPSREAVARGDGERRDDRRHEHKPYRQKSIWHELFD